MDLVQGSLPCGDSERDPGQGFPESEREPEKGLLPFCDSEMNLRQGFPESAHSERDPGRGFLPFGDSEKDQRRDCPRFGEFSCEFLDSGFG